MQRRRGSLCTVLCAAIILFAFVQPGPAQSEKPRKIVLKGPELGPPVTPYQIDIDVRTLPPPRQWQPGDPIKEIPRRSKGDERFPIEPRPVGMDPAAQLEESRPAAIDAFTTPSRNFPGVGFTAVNPPDTVGDVGPNHYIQLVNTSSGTQVRIWDKATPTPAQLADFALDSLGTGPCANGLGDPIVLYDRQADRWLLSEFASSGNNLCVYISQTPDPLGAYFAYAFVAPNFPDYPKYAVWPTDANGGQGSYIITTNEDGPAVYALPRGAMLAGGVAASQRFSTIPPLSGFPFEGTLAPADIDGPNLPPSAAPAPIVQHRDTEVHGPAGFPTQDFLEVWEFNVDWTTPANTTLTLLSSPGVPIAEIDSDLCGLVSFSCFPQPITSTTLDPLREPVMNRLQYINHVGYQALVGDFVTDVNGANLGGMRWFELRGGPGSWTLFQEGTYSIDIHNRWIGGIAADQNGNIALGYSVSSSSVFPNIRYTGRLSSDPAGIMSQPETIIIAGTASNGSNRWGDYAAMSLDPSDDCTFWYTTMYNAATTWSTRVASFKFDTCGTSCPIISLDDILPDGATGSVYSSAVTASGGTAPYSYNVTSGALPNGLTLNTNGTLSGTPTADGVFNFDVTATDANTCTGTHSYSVTITCGGITLDDTLPDGSDGVAYSGTILASGGTPGYTFAQTGGTLPTGLTLNSNGTLTGTPSAAGTFNFDVTATDTSGCTGTLSYSITISGACVFNDDFSDGIVDWLVVKPNVTETGGNLVLTPTTRKAETVASPVFAGCSTCSLHTTVQTSGGIGSRLWVLGWYIDKKNTVELLFKEEKDVVILKQRIGGKILAKQKASVTIVPNTVYDVVMGFNGSQMSVSIGGNSVITLSPVGSPTGVPGFRAKNTTGTFDFACVN